MINILYLTVFLFSFSSNSSLASCVTGYACSINELKNQEKAYNDFINKSNNYYKYNINDSFILINQQKNLEYNDFFPFSFIVYTYDLKH